MKGKNKNDKKPGYEKCFCCGTYFKPDKKKDLYCPDCRERELAKDMAKQEKALKRTYEPLELLAAAIIERACGDYMKAIKQWHNAYTPTSKKIAWSEIRQLSKWFKSPDFELYANQLVGSRLQSDLSDLAMKKIHNQRIKKNEAQINALQGVKNSCVQ